MKIRISLLLIALAFTSAHAQFGRTPNTPNLSGSMAKLFGDNTAFSADMEMESTGGADAGPGGTMTGKISFDQGKTRFEMDLANMKGGRMPPQATAQMKAMGMDKMVMISLPEKKVSYLIYPGLQAYAENPARDAETNVSPADFKIELTELGKETVDGHPCVKHKAVVTDKEGKTHESTVWNATDLKDFPLQIMTKEKDDTIFIRYRQVQLAKPEEKDFDAPAGYKEYAEMEALMQGVMAKMTGGGSGK